MKRLEKFRVGAQNWEHWEATEEEYPALKGRWGLCVYEESRIYTQPHESKEQFVDTVTHEKFHAWLYATGLHVVLKTYVKVKNYEKWEEYFTRIAVPHIVAYQKDNK